MEKILDCKYCKLSFRSSEDYVDHMEKVHSEGMQADDL